MDREKELKFFEDVRRLIAEEADRLEEGLKERKESIDKAKEYVNENLGLVDDAELVVSLSDVNNLVETAQAEAGRLFSLRRLHDNPYFGRIDFTEEGSSKTREVRLGMSGFFSQAEKKIMIYDWRAPISSLYYDYELGEAAYTVRTVSGGKSETRQYRGVISEKDQFIVKNGEMLRMVETGQRINDELLLSALSGNAPAKMKSVIATIQKEQNAVIRDADSEVLVVDGRAGSGKTVIAMHRLAWLLYNNPGVLNSQNVLILSPNRVFSDYISDIMPELGEDYLPEKDWDSLMQELILSDYEYESSAEQAEAVRTAPADSIRLRNLRIKNSYAFYDAFTSYIDEVFIRNLEFKDFHYEKLTYPAEKLEKMFYGNFSSLPPYERFYNIAFFILDDYLLTSGRKFSEGRNEKIQRQIADLMIARFAKPDLMEIYVDFLSVAEKVYPGIGEIRGKDGRLYYEDMQLLFWLQIRLYGCNSYKDVRHVMIDEMQDYSVFRLAIIKQLFPGRKTFLGDRNQVLIDNGESVTDVLARLFPEHRLVKLRRCYRSTAEITRFANSIAGEEWEAADGYERHGSEPKVTDCIDEEDQAEKIKECIGKLGSKDYESIAVICANDEEAYGLYRRLSGTGAAFLSEQSPVIRKGVSVMSAFISKGMEFDAVIVASNRPLEKIKAESRQSDKSEGTQAQKADEDGSQYGTKETVARNALFIACTRALHELHLFGIKQ